MGLELLGASQREVIVLRDYDRVSWIEVGERLGIAEDAARMRYRRAVDRLSDVVAQLRRRELAQVLADLPDEDAQE